MDLEKTLVGENVKIYYDRHIIDTSYASSSAIDTIEGAVEGICGDMIYISYMFTKDVYSTQKGLFSDRVTHLKKETKMTSLINMKYVVRIDLL